MSMVVNQGKRLFPRTRLQGIMVKVAQPYGLVTRLSFSISNVT